MAAFLCSEGYPFLRVEKVSKGIAQMVFDGDDMLGAAVEEYQCGEARVEPRTFTAKLTFVRARLRGVANGS